MTDSKNTILAIALSALVLIAWQFFFAMPQEKARQEKLQAEQLAQKQQMQTQVQPKQSGQPSTIPAQPGQAQVPGQTAQAPAAVAAQSRRRAGGVPARPDRHGQPAGLDRPQRRTHRRSGAHQVSRDGRSEVAADRTAVAVGQPRSVLRRIWLDQRRRRQRKGPHIGHGVDAIGFRARSASAIR